MKIYLFAIAMLLFASCNKAPAAITEQLKDSDSVAFNFYRAGTASVENIVIVKDSLQVRNIARLIKKGNLTNEICDPTGDLHFFDKNQVVFSAFFSTSDSCKGIAYNFQGQGYNAKVVTEFENLTQLLNQKTK